MNRCDINPSLFPSDVLARHLRGLSRDVTGYSYDLVHAAADRLESLSASLPVSSDPGSGTPDEVKQIVDEATRRIDDVAEDVCCDAWADTRTRFREAITPFIERAYALGAKAEAERATADDAVAVRNAAMWKAGYEAGVAERAEEDRPGDVVSEPIQSLGDEATAAIDRVANDVFGDVWADSHGQFREAVTPFLNRAFALGRDSRAADRVERDERAGGTTEKSGLQIGLDVPRDAFDTVNRPAHYAATRIECIDAIGAMVESWPGESAYYAGNVVKYVWRHRGKQSVESLRKARWYLDRLIALAASSSVARGET